MSRPAEKQETAFTLVTEFFKCSAVKGRKWAIIPCSRTATIHITEGGGAPFCTEHGMNVVRALAKGGRIMTDVK